jgi:hypothetical protein
VKVKNNIYILVLAFLISGVSSASYKIDCVPSTKDISFTLKGIFDSNLSNPHIGQVTSFSISKEFKNLTGCPLPKIKQFSLQWKDAGKFLMHRFEYSEGCELHIVLPNGGSNEGWVWLEKVKHRPLVRSRQEFESYRAETLLSQCTMVDIKASPNK